MTDFQKAIDAAAKRYADAQVEIVSLQIQRAFLEGAMEAIKQDWTSRALEAANDAAS